MKPEFKFDLPNLAIFIAKKCDGFGDFFSKNLADFL